MTFTDFTLPTRPCPLLADNRKGLQCGGMKYQQRKEVGLRSYKHLTVKQNLKKYNKRSSSDKTRHQQEESENSE